MLKQKVYSTQIKASIAVNSALIQFYWDLGKSISEKENIWGSKLLEQVSTDLQAEFPDMKGISIRNLKYCRNFYKYYFQAIGQQAVAQLQGTGNKNVNNAKLAQQSVGQFQSQNIQSYPAGSLTSQQPIDQFVRQVVAQIPWGITF